jgi:tetratricopeptide (TPR) repeat protein
MGRRESALTTLRRAMALDPLSVRVNMDAGWLLLQAHHFDEAIAQAKRAQELQPGLREADACIARARLYQGQGAAPPDPADPSCVRRSKRCGANAKRRSSRCKRRIPIAVQLW